MGTGQRDSQKLKSQEYLETLQGTENQRERISLIFLLICSAKSRNAERRKDETETSIARLGMGCHRYRNIPVCNLRKRIHREVAMRIPNMVMTISELVESGYPESVVRQIARSQKFEEVGFSTGDKRKTYYFFVEKLDELLKKGTWLWS